MSNVGRFIEPNTLVYQSKQVRAIYKIDRLSRMPYYELDFLGSKTNIYTNFEGIMKYIEKRESAYGLIPKDCIVVPKHLIGNFYGKLIGGILEDSISIVYGICEAKLSGQGLKGYSCSVYFIPSLEIMREFTEIDNAFQYEGIFTKEDTSIKMGRFKERVKQREEEIYRRMCEYAEKGAECLVPREEVLKVLGQDND